MLLYGDTNSTLAGALVSVKARIPIAHVEAGVRAGGWETPEESNRVVADRLSAWAFCATRLNYETLVNEGLGAVAHLVGDVMYDVALFMRDVARTKSNILATLGLAGRPYVLATCHRAETTDDRHSLAEVLGAMERLSQDLPVVLPMHPRTAKRIAEFKLEEMIQQLIVTKPLGFLDMVALEASASIIVTDSGGVQKEAFFHGVPCVIAHKVAHWPELVALGNNVVAGVDRGGIVAHARAALGLKRQQLTASPFGDGHAADQIVDILLKGA
jgi:UDP-GlcNAc3NAcA epimerase